MLTLRTDGSLPYGFRAHQWCFNFEFFIWLSSCQLYEMYVSQQYHIDRRTESRLRRKVCDAVCADTTPHMAQMRGKGGYMLCNVSFFVLHVSSHSVLFHGSIYFSSNKSQMFSCWYGFFFFTPSSSSLIIFQMATRSQAKRRNILFEPTLPLPTQYTASTNQRLPTTHRMKQKRSVFHRDLVKPQEAQQVAPASQCRRIKDKQVSDENNNIEEIMTNSVKQQSLSTRFPSSNNQMQWAHFPAQLVIQLCVPNTKFRSKESD